MNEVSNQVELFLNIATLAKNDQEKVAELVTRLGGNKKANLKKAAAHPKAGFLKGAFQPATVSDGGSDTLIEFQTDNSSEI